MLLKHTHREYHYWKATQSQRLLKNKKKKIYLPRIYIDDYPCTCPLMWCLAADVPTWKKIKKKEKNCSEQREQHATEESARTYVSIKYQKKNKNNFQDEGIELPELRKPACYLTRPFPMIIHTRHPNAFLHEVQLTKTPCTWLLTWREGVFRTRCQQKKRLWSGKSPERKIPLFVFFPLYRPSLFVCSVIYELSEKRDWETLPPYRSRWDKCNLKTPKKLKNLKTL